MNDTKLTAEELKKREKELLCNLLSKYGSKKVIVNMCGYAVAKDKFLDSQNNLIENIAILNNSIQNALQGEHKSNKELIRLNEKMNNINSLLLKLEEALK